MRDIVALGEGLALIAFAVVIVAIAVVAYKGRSGPTNPGKGAE